MMQTADDCDQPFELPIGAMLLQGQYEIQQHLAIGGFGITYLARDSLSRQVVVKECFPDGLCIRNGRLVLPDSESKQVPYQKIVWNFVAEARRLAKLKHPNIVAVHQVFEENHTAYMAMDYVEGEELLDILETTPDRLTPDLLQKTLREALSAIQHLHGLGILHRDISPDNLLIDSHDHLTLIDFGAAREHATKDAGSASYLLAVKDGYSPHEFYVEDAPQDASSDLYSLAATYYHLITGEAPPDCWSRLKAMGAGEADPCTPLVAGDWPFEPGFLALIDQALSVRKDDRINTATAWLERLDEVGQQTEPAVETEPAKQARPAPRKTLPVIELDLQAISRLVEDTNTGLVGNSNGAPSRTRTPEPVPEPEIAEPAPKQHFDIFGNPIENVEEWMQEQDRLTRTKKIVETLQATAAGEKNKNASKDGKRRSLISRLLSKPLRLARDPASTA